MGWKIEDMPKQMQEKVRAKMAEKKQSLVGPVKITLSGQCHGGKNSMGVTRTGIHYPKKPFRLWRDEAIRQVKAQYNGETFCAPLYASIAYYAGDRRRRDLPAILDAIWHVLERSGVVADDALIKDLDYKTGYDKDNPRAVIWINEINRRNNCE